MSKYIHDRFRDESEKIEALIKLNTAAIIRKAFEVKAGHIGGSLSMSQFLLPLLYWLEKSRDNYEIVLGKGHAALGLYSILHTLGVSSNAYEEFCQRSTGSLHGHTTKRAFEKLIASTGSLGHGLPIAAGKAYADRLFDVRNPILCVMGDGELQEGTFAEVLLQHKLLADTSLKILVDNNHSVKASAIDGTNILPSVYDISVYDSSSLGHLVKAYQDICSPGLSVLIFETKKMANIKGHENNPRWHAGLPKDEAELSMLIEMIDVRLGK